MLYLNKKFLILVTIAIIILVAAIIFIIFRQKKQNTIESSIKLAQISQDKILYPTISQDGTKFLFFANTKEAAFYSMDLNGSNLQQISDSLDTPDDIIWAPDRKSVIIKVIYDQYIFEKYGSKYASPGTPDQTETTWFYNLTNSNLTRLDNHIGNVVWTGDAKLIYEYLNRDKNANYLGISDSNGTNWSKIIDLPSLVEYGFNLTPDNKNLLIYSLPSDISESQIYNLNLEKKELKQIKTINGQTKALAISNDNFIFTSPSKNKSKEIIFCNLDGSREKDLKINSVQLTYVKFSENKILLPSSNDQTDNSVLYSLDLTNQKLNQIKDLTSDKIDIQMLLESKNPKILYFVSNDLIYSLTLP